MNNHIENTKRNKEMFLWLSTTTNMYSSVSTSQGKILTELMNEWQRHVFDKYVKNSYTKHYEITTEAT